VVLVSLPPHKFVHPQCYYRLWEIKHYSVGMSSEFSKNQSISSKMHTQHCDLTSLYIFFLLRKKNRPVKKIWKTKYWSSKIWYKYHIRCLRI